MATEGLSGTKAADGINPSAVVTGAKVSFYLGDDNTPVAYAQAVSYTINHELVPVYGLDRLTAFEYAEVGYSVTFSVTRFRVPQSNKSVHQKYTGSPMALGWQSPLSNLLTQGCISARFYDKSGSQVILKVDGVKMTSRSGTVSARDLATETLDFVGRIAWGEALPDGDTYL